MVSTDYNEDDVFHSGPSKSSRRWWFKMMAFGLVKFDYGNMPNIEAAGARNTQG